ncbi:Lsr2 dimerization domain-containing protein [Rudaeicoccus suwonensis]|uniref:Lsr2 dimerization domain-containing protein n=1 Tax=Rudaeicoccus suwonensis TaxID=657409 RepID=UPI003CCC468C
MDGVQCGIDLTGTNASKLRDALKPYIEHGRCVGGRKTSSTAAARRSTKTDPSQLPPSGNRHEALATRSPTGV